MKAVFLVFAVSLFASSSHAQEGTGERLAERNRGELLGDPMDPSMKSAEMPPPSGGAIVMSEEPALLRGSCEYRRRIAGLVKVYQICGHSTDAKLQGWDESLAENGARKTFMLSLDFTYDVGGERAADSFLGAMPEEGIDEATRQAFRSFVLEQEYQEGSRLELFFNPASNEELVLKARYKDEKQQSVFESKDRDFARVLAEIWLGEKPVDKKIKKALLR